jgi:hypothetical protein
LGGPVSSIAVVQNHTGALELFGVGSDGHIFHKWETTPGGSWSNEENLGGPVSHIAVGMVGEA